MILPSTYFGTLALLVVSMLCFGLWPNTCKLTGEWRFELYYFDFALGAMLTAALAALTFGTLGLDSFSFLDDLLHASKKQDLYAFLAGSIFNLANMLLVGALSLAGLSVAFPISVGVAVMLGVFVSRFLKPQGSPGLLFAGAGLLAASVVVTWLAYRAYHLGLLDDLVRTGKVKSTRKTVSVKALVVALASGLVMSLFPPLLQRSMEGDAGLGPYSATFLFAAGLFASTFLFNLFFMNLPLAGQPLEIFDFFKGSLRRHGWAILGGVLFSIGLLCSLVAGVAEGKASLDTGIRYGMTQAAALIAAIAGLLVWREFANAPFKVKSLLAVMVALFALGLLMISAAPMAGVAGAG